MSFRVKPIWRGRHFLAKTYRSLVAARV